MAVRLTVGGNVLLVRLGGLVRGSGGDELVRKLGLVGRVGDLDTMSARATGYERSERTHLIVSLGLVGVVAEPAHCDRLMKRVEVVVVVSG